MDKGDRSRLYQVMDNLPQIEEWRQTITLAERLKLNHPNAVLRKWKAFIEPEKRPDPNAPPKPTLKDSVASLSEENAGLKAHIEELEAARTAEATDPVQDIVGRIERLSEPDRFQLFAFLKHIEQEGAAVKSTEKRSRR